MTKRAQSIDGFVPKSNRRRITLSDVNDVQPSVNTSNKFHKEHQADGFYPAEENQDEQPTIIEESTNPGDGDLINDIEKSLDEIGDLDVPGEAPAGRKTHKPKKPKKKFNAKKSIKIFFLVVFLLVLAIAGYFAIKTLLAGGKVFKGNPLSILTSKSRLAEDKNGRTNILIFGTSGYSMDENAWDGAMLTDSIMVLSLDQDDHSAYMMSLPRDLYVQHTCPPLGTSYGKLNETFYCAYDTNKDEEAGAKALMEKAGDILGLDLQYYVHADWTALVQSVNAVGGVDVKIESSDPRGIYDSSTNLRYSNGEVAHLDGEKALALARARNHNYGDYGLSKGNYDREKNQQKILAALQQKALSAGTILNPTAINGLLDSIGSNLITSFQTSNVQTLIDIASQIKAKDIKHLSFVGREDGGPDLIDTYSEDGAYKGEAPVAGPFDYSEIRAYIAKNLSSNPVTREGATIDVLNGSDVPGLASKMADKLKEDSYNVKAISNSPENLTAKVTIYQMNTSKPKTAEALKKKFGVEIQDGAQLTGYSTESDFVIIYGTANSE